MKADDSCQILTKIQQLLSVWRIPDPDRMKPLVCLDRHIVRAGRNDRMTGYFYFSTEGRCFSRINDLPVFLISKQDRAIIRPFPASVAQNTFLCPVFEQDLQLSQQLGLGTILIRQAESTAGTAIPTVCQQYRQLIFPFDELVFDIIDLILNTFAIVRISRSKELIADLLSLQRCFVGAAG